MPARATRPLAALALLGFVLSACGGGGGGSAVPLTATHTSPSSSGGSGSAFTCPSEAGSSAVSTGSGSAGATSFTRRMAAGTRSVMTSSSLIAVTYRDGARRIVSAEPSRLGATAASLRQGSGVLDAQPVQYRYSLTTNPYLTNDPFFRGESGTSSPLYETSSLQGQWDMHVIQLEHAFAYSQDDNGSGIVNPGALGSTSVKLAIIDTGVDVTHPDIEGDRIVRTECFITNSSTGVQSTGTSVVDENGHGTDVTGIAAATTNNGYGFAGAGGNVSLMLYRVFPTPDDSCTSDSSTDPRCGAADVDIASAIDDAVANGANVINMSFGGGSCTNGKDPDTTEGAAISNALAHDVILVAAAGNAKGEGLTAPACDTGVIAVGASAYNDGKPNGSGYTGSDKEYLATSYSQYGATNDPKSPSSWGLLAPGGDATGTTDPDDLHWIENIWTSTPYDGNFEGNCGVDVFGESGDCQTFIEGTSMSSAHVAGAAALVLSVSGKSGPYASPAAMFRLLCTTADDIGDPHEGCGRLNVYRAVATAVHDPNLP